MATAWSGPCPLQRPPLLHSKAKQEHDDPQVLTLSQVIAVSRAPFLMGDYLRPPEKTPTPK
jgi:hypothetical protein